MSRITSGTPWLTPVNNFVPPTTLTNTLTSATPTGSPQTPATPSTRSPLDLTTFDRLFAKVLAYAERTSHNPEDTYLTAERMKLTSLPYDILPADMTELYIGGNLLVELDCALLPKTLEVLDISHCLNFKHILNIDQLPNLAELNVSDTRICSLPSLPGSLHTLNVSHCTQLTALPAIGRTHICRLEMSWSGVESITQFPETLRLLYARYSKLGVELPMLPDSLVLLDLDGTPAVTEGFLPERPDTVTHLEYTETARAWWNACLRKERFESFHEELMMAAWHPTRVSKWLLHGEEVLDMMMGC